MFCYLDLIGLMFIGVNGFFVIMVVVYVLIFEVVFYDVRLLKKLNKKEVFVVLW